MKALTLIFCLLIAFFMGTCSQTSAPPPSAGPVPYTPDASTVALWHFDEPSGSIAADASAKHHNGVVYGATVVPGQFANARAFDSVSSYIIVPPDTSLNLDTSSFTINLWFKTDGQPAGMLLRRGVAPVPGYVVSLSYGRVAGAIGNQEYGPFPDTVITIISTATYTDGKWHSVALIRDRSVRKLYLYVDGVSAATPIDDPVTMPLNNDRPLTIGRWENTSLPWFFKGSIDEVRIQRGVHTP